MRTLKSFYFGKLGGPWGDRMMIRHTPLPSQNAYDILMYHIHQDAMQFRHGGEASDGKFTNRSRTSLEGELKLGLLIKISTSSIKLVGHEYKGDII